MFNQNKIPALISLLVAISILLANFFQWWNITYNGGMKIKGWVKLLLCVGIILLVLSGYLLFSSN